MHVDNALRHMLAAATAADIRTICTAVSVPPHLTAHVAKLLQKSPLVVFSKRGLASHVWHTHISSLVAAAAVAVDVLQWAIDNTVPSPRHFREHVHKCAAGLGLHVFDASCVRLRTDMNLRNNRDLVRKLELSGLAGLSAANVYKEYALAFEDLHIMICNKTVIHHRGRVWPAKAAMQCPGQLTC